MELSDLVGKHELTGLSQDMVKAEYRYDDDATAVIFTLDGVHYLAMEDPEDGYRSCMREIIITDKAPNNTFPPCSVECSMMPDESYETNDVLVFTDTETGKVVLEIGTGNYDDYYPYWVFNWMPQNMSVNN